MQGAEPEESLRHAFLAALAAVSPRDWTRRAIADDAASPAAGGVRLIAAGKAAAAMAQGAIDALGEAVVEALVVTRDPLPASIVAPAGTALTCLQAGHPRPDARSLEAAERALALASRRDRARLLLCVSGGASALLCAPASGVTLDDKIAATSALAAAGADIATLNTLRRHLSRIKGGQLAAAAAPAPVDVLVWSDVLGDDPSVVGGGPAAGAVTSARDALRAVDAHGLRARLPATVLEQLERAAAGDAGAPGGPIRRGDARLAHVRTRVLAGPDDLAAAAAAALRARGVLVDHLETRAADPVESLAARLAARAQALAWRLAGAPAPTTLAAVVSGEPTVALPPSPGRGGRAQQTALEVARRLDAMRWPEGVRAAALCAASDGSDGPTADAGGLVDATTWARAGRPLAALAGFAAGPALAAAGALFTIGPTGNNLCDLYIVAATTAAMR